MSASWRFPPDDGPESPWPIFERVLDYPELDLQASLFREHEVRWAFVMRAEHGEGGWSRGQRRVYGMACIPAVQGMLAGLFEQLLEDTLGYMPDFLIILDVEFWEGAGDMQREALVFHELKHCGQATDRYGVPKFTRLDNRPILTMVDHDIEEFDDVVRRYGAWKSDITRFVEAVGAGPRRENSAPAREARLTPAERQLAPEMVVHVPDLAAVAAAMADAVEVPIPENVDNVAPDLKADKLNRDNPSQDKSRDDVF